MHPVMQQIHDAKCWDDLPPEAKSQAIRDLMDHVAAEILKARADTDVRRGLVRAVSLRAWTMMCEKLAGLT